MAAGYDGTIKIDTSINSAGFNQGTKGIAAGIGNVTGALAKMAAAVGIAFGVNALINFGKSALEVSSNVEEMANMFGVSFRDMTSSVMADLTAFAKATNRSRYDLMTFASQMQSLLVPMGFARDTAAQMAVQIVKLATDLASFKNLNTADVIRDIQSGMVGEAEALRKYGVNASEAAIQQEALNSGLWNGTGAISAAVKAQAVLNIMMRSTTDAQGDAARTSGSYANQIRGLEAAWTDFKLALGDAIKPVILAIIPYIKNIILWLTEMAKKFAIFLSVFFGVDLSAGVEELAKASGDAAAAQDDLAASTTKADKAAKGALAAFDQLNVLQQDNANIDAAAKTPADLSPTLPSSVDMPVTPKLTDASLEGFRAQMENLKKTLTEIFQPLFDVAKIIWDILKPVLMWLLDRLVEFGKWAQDNPAVFKALLVVILAIVFIINVLIPIVGAVIAVFGALGWVAAALGITITMTVAGFVSIIAVIAMVIIAIVLLVTHWQEVGTFFVSIWTTVQQLWVIAGFWFLDHVVNPIRAAFASLLDWLPGGFKTAFDGVIGWVKGAVNTIIGFINSMISAIVGGINATINALNSISIKIPDWVPLLGGQTWQTHIGNVTAPQIPRLATGAVIPPNAQFAAILGDQKSGRNIEAPESLIRQIVREEMGTVKTEVTVNFAGNLASLVRELRPYIERENIRIGASLIKGGSPA